MMTKFASQFDLEPWSIDDFHITNHTMEGQLVNNEWLLSNFDPSLFEYTSSDLLNPNDSTQYETNLDLQQMSMNSQMISPHIHWTDRYTGENQKEDGYTGENQKGKRKKETSSAARSRRWRIQQKAQLVELRKENASLQEKLREMTLQRNEALMEASNLRALVIQKNDWLRNENNRLQKLVSTMKFIE